MTNPLNPLPKSVDSSTTLEIRPAKGRPMLTWVGKQPLRHVTAFPAQLVERYGEPAASWQGWPAAYPPGGLLFHGDNKEVLAHLLANGFRGKVKLVYIDPPFDSGADYVRKVELRNVKEMPKLDSEEYAIGEQLQYTDIWANDNYLQFVYERFLLLKEMLSDDGSLWLHCDYHRSHYLKCILDEVFSDTSFISEIIWNRSTPRGNVKRGLSVAHDTIFVYGKGSEAEWHPPLLDYSDDYEARFTKSDEDGRRYTLDSMINPNPNRPNLNYVWNGVRRVWRVTKERMAELESIGRIEYTSNGVARYKRYLDELEGRPLTTLWSDIFPVNSQAEERVDYPTQKPEDLLRRIIETSTVPGDLVLDCFLGSGTTAAVAQKLGRRWIGCDINKGAIQTSAKRLQTILQEQAAAAVAAAQAAAQPALPGLKAGPPDETPAPAQASFAVYRVNDYDLQIQHNEAVQLACEQVGIVRTRSDAYFDGMHGKALAKIIPFNHPLGLLDLEDLRRELQARPEEARDITLVCLGKETAVDGWLEDWNRHRSSGGLPNRLQVIELRTDPRYGKFFIHQPASAQVEIRRENGEICVNILDFISPSIIERLQTQAGVLTPQIDDWRAMVDTVMIDPAYDGQVFNIALADVPERKSDLVAGEYRLPAPDGETTVAVKITDMLGEEVLVVARI